MLQVLKEKFPITYDDKVCPSCGEGMTLRENSTTFWEKQKERYAYHCNNTNCLHKIALLKEELDILRVEQSLLRWEMDLETIEHDIIAQYELKELLTCLKKTFQYLRKGKGNLPAKEFFIQELRNPGGQKKFAWQWKMLVVPLVVLAITIGTISFFGPVFNTMMEASILSIPR